MAAWIDDDNEAYRPSSFTIKLINYYFCPSNIFHSDIIVCIYPDNCIDDKAMEKHMHFTNQKHLLYFSSHSVNVSRTRTQRVYRVGQKNEATLHFAEYLEN